MKRIGIVTLYHNNNNYGGQLQAYAMQTLFSTADSEARLISFETPAEKYIVKRIRDLGPGRFVTSALRKILFREFVKRNPRGRQYRRRLERFRDFGNAMRSTELYSEDTIQSSNELFDVFVCGSDQVWNPGWWNDILLLRFADKPKYAYAASIGREALGEADAKRLKEAVRDFQTVSVREEQAAAFLRDLLQRDVPLALDPTLLISRGEWSRLADKPWYEGRYALLYMLGNDWSMKREIYARCQSLGIPLIEIALEKDLYYSAQMKYADLFVCDAGPAQWLGWIRNADYVFTDSFHGTVFSVLFEKEFWCFTGGRENDGKNCNSRIYSFLSLAGLSGRLLRKGEHAALSLEQSAIDYEAVSRNLQSYRVSSLELIERIVK